MIMHPAAGIDTFALLSCEHDDIDADPQAKYCQQATVIIFWTHELCMRMANAATLKCLQCSIDARYTPNGAENGIGYT